MPETGLPPVSSSSGLSGGLDAGTVCPLLFHPDPILRLRCEPAGFLTSARIRDLVRDRLATMSAAGGRGLAAPQIGVLRRVFVQIGACDLDGLWRRHSLTNPAARIAQHETDRLDSRLIVDSPA